MNWVRFRSWLVQDFPGLKPACSGMRCWSTREAMRFRMSLSNNLYVWQSSKMGRWLLVLAGSFLGFRMPTTFARLHNFGIFIVDKQLLNVSRNHWRAIGPKCSTCSQRMTSCPAALLWIITLMPSSSSLVVKGLVKLKLSWSSLADLGNLIILGQWPGFSQLFMRNWWTAWSAVISYRGCAFVKSFLSIFMVFQTFLLLRVIFVHSISSWHLFRRFSDMALISLSPDSKVSFPKRISMEAVDVVLGEFLSILTVPGCNSSGSLSGYCSWRTFSSSQQKHRH